MKENIEQKIKNTIEKIRPFLIKYEENIVYIKLKGACESCPMMDITIKDGIEQLLINEVSEIKEVRNIS